MHRIMMPDGTYRQSAFLRASFTVSYLMFAVAGGLFLRSPAYVDRYGPLAVVMAWFMLIGAVLAGYGSATRKWYGEFTGLPLLGTAFSVLGVEFWQQGHHATPWMAWGVLLVLTGVAGIIGVARWRVMLSVYLLAHGLAQQDEEASS